MDRYLAQLDVDCVLVISCRSDDQKVHTYAMLPKGVQDKVGDLHEFSAFMARQSAENVENRRPDVQVVKTSLDS